MLIDTHAHIYVKEFKDDIDEVIKNARERGIGHIFLPNINKDSILSMHELEKRYSFCHAMMGLHPCDVKSNYKDELTIMRQWLEKRSYAAIGEIGLDLYWDKTFATEQEEAFRTQIEWAVEFHLPIVIHSRESLDLTIHIVSEYASEQFTGIFHCFTGTEEQARKIIGMNFYLGIGGVLTYKNAGLDKVLTSIPLERMVLETDSPYLPPVPHRGKRNEPAFLYDVAQKLATVKETTPEEIAVITSNNVKKIFLNTSIDGFSAIVR